MQIGTQAERDVCHTLDKQMDDFSDFAFFVVLFVVDVTLSLLNVIRMSSDCDCMQRIVSCMTGSMMMNLIVMKKNGKIFCYCLMKEHVSG